jgi:hypothetical protein
MYGIKDSRINRAHASPLIVSLEVPASCIFYEQLLIPDLYLLILYSLRKTQTSESGLKIPYKNLRASPPLRRKADSRNVL